MHLSPWFLSLRRLAQAAISVAFFAASAQAQTVSGTVREVDGGPLRLMVVAAYTVGGTVEANTTTDNSGRYDLTLPAGQYRLLTYDPTGIYATEFANDAPSFEESPLVALTVNQVVPLNFSVRRGVAISGNAVTSGGPRAGMTVAAYNLSGTRRGFTTTNGAGNFSIILPPGDYKFVAYDDAGVFAPSFFRDQDSFDTANVVTVQTGKPQTNITFFLPLAIRVAGIVTDTARVPIADATVLVYAANKTYLGFMTTGADGRFAFTLPPGAYRFVAIDPSFQFAAGFPSDATSFETSPVISLNAGQSKTDLTIRLERGGRVEGDVIDRATGAPIRGITVAAYNGDGTMRTSVTTGANGHYTILLPPGSFRIAAFDSNLVYATQFYPQQPNFARAISISPTTGQTISLQPFTLSHGGRISGTVTDQFSHAAVTGSIVQAFDDNGLLTAETVSIDGTYRLVLPPGNYRLVAADPQFHYAPGYSGAAKNFDSATTVSVAADTDTTVSFALARGTLVTGSVVDETHQPIPGIQVSALDANQDRVATATTAADGTFRLVVVPDKYKFIAVDPNGLYRVAYMGGTSFADARSVNVDSTGAPPLTVIIASSNRRRAVHH